ncbi:MAG TPA: hypothetical protein VF725_14115 [Ktedonobacterales bacterium]|jgi:hypothetical protein
MRKRDVTIQYVRRATLDAGFTPAETERLLALRQDFTGHAEHSELLLDLDELEFARWLVQHGRMTEDALDEGSNSGA